MKRMWQKIATFHRERVGITPDEKRALAGFLLLVVIGLLAWAWR